VTIELGFPTKGAQPPSIRPPLQTKKLGIQQIIGLERGKRGKVKQIFVLLPPSSKIERCFSAGEHTQL
jgi:hypothetical protein